MKRTLKLLLAVAAVVGLAGTAQAAKYKVIEVSDGGSITGKVSAGGAAPESQPFTISKNPEVCGTGTRDVLWVRTNGDALMDAVVYLDKVKEGKDFPAGTDQITIDQKGCEFSPFLGSMANEGELTATNSDPVLHNIHTYELIKTARRTVINVSQPEQGDTFKKKIKLRKGVAMKVECDAHDFMHAFVFVAHNPYYAVVDENGGFTIDNVPAGKYVVKVWHGRLGEQEAEAEVSAGGSAEVNFAY